MANGVKTPMVNQSGIPIFGSSTAPGVLQPAAPAPTQPLNAVSFDPSSNPFMKSIAELAAAQTGAIEAASTRLDPLKQAFTAAMPTFTAERVAGPTTSRFAEDQLGLVRSLQAQAAGEAPSLAEAQLRAAQDAAVNQQMALAASLSGRALPAAQRQVAQQAAFGQQQLGQQAAIARMQEQQLAQQQLAQALQGARGQDQASQEMAQRAAMFNTQQALEAQSAQDAAQLARQQAAANVGLAQFGAQTENIFSGIGAGLEAASQVEQQRANKDIGMMEGAQAKERIVQAGREQRKTGERQAVQKAIAGAFGSAADTLFDKKPSGGK